MDLSTNKMLFGLVLVASLWAPVYLVRIALAFIDPASRTRKKAVFFALVLAGLVAGYAFVLDDTTRIGDTVAGSAHRSHSGNAHAKESRRSMISERSFFEQRAFKPRPFQ